MLKQRDHTSQMPIATKSSKINISDENKTKLIAELFSRNLVKGDILFFYGPLGVGKTTFIKFLINSLQKKNNIDLTEVTSPTFNLINEYQIDSVLIKHCDLYRVNDHKELPNLGIFENINNQITLIEWPERIKSYKSPNVIKLFFEYDDDYNKRILSVSTKKNIQYLNELK